MTANINASSNTCITLEGEWFLKDNRWVSDQTSNYLLFIERQKTKPKQVGQYILSVNPSGARTYVSSVYPRGENKYKIDFQGVVYILERTSLDALRVSIGHSPTI